MAKENMYEEEQLDVRLIPDNFMNDGKMFNGMVRTRNFFEAVLIGAGLWFIEYAVMAGLRWTTLKMAVTMIMTIGPVAIIAIVGINGDSLTQFISLFITFMKNKRKLRFRRIVKNAKTSGSRAKSRPTNSKKKTSRTSAKK